MAATVARGFTAAMELLVLQHLDCEHPGAFTAVMDAAGVTGHTVELDQGDPLPDWRAFDGILAMGGPMGAGDESAHGWLVEEKRRIGDAVAAGMPFLGVCLGAQLLAAALGAEVHASPGGPEVGLLPVDLTPAGAGDALFAGLPRRFDVLHWHGDTFALPDGGTHLASSDHTPQQAFRWGERAYGLQFHLEVTAEQAQTWAMVPAYCASLESTLGEAAGEAFLADVAGRAGDLTGMARRVFANWLAIARR